MRPHIPHRQFRQKLLAPPTGRIRPNPTSFFQRPLQLIGKFSAGGAIQATIKNSVTELMHTNIASTISVIFKSEQIFFTTRGNQPPHAARPLVTSQAIVFRQFHPFVVTKLGQVRRYLIAPDDMQLRAGGDQIFQNYRLVLQQTIHPSPRFIKRLIRYNLMRLDRNAVVVQASGKETILWRLNRGNSRASLRDLPLLGSPLFPVPRTGTQQKQQNPTSKVSAFHGKSSFPPNFEKTNSPESLLVNSFLIHKAGRKLYTLPFRPDAFRSCRFLRVVSIKFYQKKQRNRAAIFPRFFAVPLFHSA